LASPTSSQAITLHTSRAAAFIGDKLMLQLGRITESSRDNDDLGSLQKYADEWNNSDLTEVTSSLAKDGQPVIDPRGLRSTVQQMSRLKRCVQDFDTAWYDVDKNISVSTC
jgi:hypothetical protein